MTLEEQAILSNYEKLTTLDSANRVWLVRDMRDGSILVSKRTVCSNPKVYSDLKDACIKGIPSIHHIFECTDDNKDEVIIIEQYVHGLTADKYFSNTDHCTEAAVIRFGIDICRILKELHSLNPPIICRDIKPSNLMIQEDRWYITDFNIARSFDSNSCRDSDTSLLGTASYAPPEQYGFGQTDIRSDLYSLAVTMNVLLTGDIPARCPAKGMLGETITRATRLDPADRYQSATEFEAALIELLSINTDSQVSTCLESNQTLCKPSGVKRLRHISTWIAITVYTLFGVAFIAASGNVTVDNMPATIVQRITTCIAAFLVIFMPYFYNADYFGILSKTLRRYQPHTVQRLIMRLLYTLLFSIVLPMTIAVIFI